MKNKHLGILYILLSAFCFALMNLFVRLSGELPSIQKSFFRNFVALVVAVILLLRQRGSGTGMRRSSWKYLFMRAAFGTIGLLCNFYAVDHLVLADASMLNKMSPFFAVLFSLFVLKERVTPFQAAIVAAALGGSILVVRPSFSNTEFLPALIGLCGGIGAGAAYTMVRKLGGLGVRGSFIVFFFSLFSCAVTLPIMMLDYVPMSGRQTALLLLAGLAATGGQFAITAAYCRAPAKEISVFDYAQIPFSALLGFLIFGQIPDALSFAGYAVIIGSAVLLFFYNTRWSAAVKSELKKT